MQSGLTKFLCVMFVIVTMHNFMQYTLSVEKRYTKSKIEKPATDKVVEELSMKGEKDAIVEDAAKSLLQSTQMNVLDVPNKAFLPFTKERRETKDVPLVPFTTFEGKRENLNSILKANLLGWEVKTNLHNLYQQTL